MDEEELKEILKDMKMICRYCVWRISSEYLAIENDWCRRDDKEVRPQQPACENFINYFIEYLT